MSDYPPPRLKPKGHPKQAVLNEQAPSRRRSSGTAPGKTASAAARPSGEWQAAPSGKPVPPRPSRETWERWERERTPMRGAQSWESAPACQAARQGGRREPARVSPGRSPARPAAAVARKAGPKQRKGKRKLRFAPFVLVTLLVAALCLGSFVFILYRDVYHQDDVFYQNVYVAGVHLGGMTREEAYRAIVAIEERQIGQWRADLRYEGPFETVVKTITATDIDLQLNLSALLENAWSQGRYGNLLARWQQINELRNTPYLAAGDGIRFNEEKLDALLRLVQQGLTKEATDASVQFHSGADGGYQYIEEKYGSWLDIEPIREQIVEGVLTLSNVSVALEPKVISPTMTMAGLQQENALVVSVYTVIRTEKGEEGRTENIRLACERLDGQRLDPGKKLSCNAVFLKRTEKNGYRDAKEIEYGEYVRGIGGGVCQVSTTLYQAALRAGLKIETRYPHALPSNYTEKGQDATITDGGKDLVIRNNGDSPVYIKARTEQNKKELRCVIEIYGKPLPNGMYFKLESKQIGMDLIAEPNVTYVKDKKQEYVHYIGQEKEVTKARKGYKIETELVGMRSDGMEISRNKITTDVYEPKPAVVYIGVLSRGND